MSTSALIYPTKSIGGCIIPTTLIFNGKIKVGKRSHPLMSTCIEIGGGKQIDEAVIVSSHNEGLVDEVLFEVVSDSPFECKELSLTRVVVFLSLG